MDVLTKRDIDALNLIRAKYVNRKMARMDDIDEDGEWVTTEEGNKIHLNKEGYVDGGSPFAIAVMGTPKNAKLPTGRVKVKRNNPVEFTYKNREALGNAFSSRKEKNVIFGGYYKVEQDERGTFKTATFFNPYTGGYFNEVIEDQDNDMVNYDTVTRQFREIEINRDVARIWNRSNNYLQEGDKIRVVKGRTIEHGTEAKVRDIRPIYDKYHRWVADYAYLDNGGKINIKNIKIVDGDELLDVKGIRARL